MFSLELNNSDLSLEVLLRGFIIKNVQDTKSFEYTFHPKNAKEIEKKSQQLFIPRLPQLGDSEASFFEETFKLKTQGYEILARGIIAPEDTIQHLRVLKSTDLTISWMKRKLKFDISQDKSSYLLQEAYKNFLFKEAYFSYLNFCYPKNFEKRASEINVDDLFI